MEQLQATLKTAQALSRVNMKHAQDQQKRYYDQGTRGRTFQESDLVLVKERVFLGQPHQLWVGPFPIAHVLGLHTYLVHCSPWRAQQQVLHMNLLKSWMGPPPMPVLAQLMVDPLAEERGWETSPSGAPVQPLVGNSLTAEEHRQLNDLLAEFPNSFDTRLGRMDAIEHATPTVPGVMVRTPWRPLPRQQWAAMNKEVDEMLQLQVTEPSRSACRSPIVLVPKPNGSIRFCIDFREVNKQAQFDTYPMPWADLLLEQ